MTTAVFYLFVVYHPQGPYITDLFGVKLEYWQGELREHGLSFRIPGDERENEATTVALTITKRISRRKVKK